MKDPLVPQSGLPLSYQPWTLKIRLKDHKSSSLGIAMEQVFSGNHPAPPLIGWGSILINGFGNFFKTQGGFGYCPAPIIYKINF